MQKGNRATGMAGRDKGDGDTEMSQVLERNINALLARREQDMKSLGVQEKIAGAISRFAGSMTFVYLHIVVFGVWIVGNLGWIPFFPIFDPSLVILAMAASVEAIFISTFVMINQNRMAAQEDKRAELSLQISLLGEHETTKLITMVSSIVRHLDIKTDVSDAELEELQRNVPPEEVLEKIERQGGA
jgi:uncharacterized membrane protein